MSSDVSWSKARLRRVLAKDPRRRVADDAGLDALVDMACSEIDHLESSPRAFALARIASMSDRPFAWASTREAFGLQLVTLVEMVRGTRPTSASQEALRAVFGAGPTIGEGYDKAWAQRAAAAARALVEGQAEPVEASPPRGSRMLVSDDGHAHAPVDHSPGSDVAYHEFCECGAIRRVDRKKGPEPWHACRLCVPGHART